LKINKKIDRIYDAASRTIRKYTISGTRMHLIAKEANIAYSGIYYYFKNIDDLLTKLQEREYKDCAEFRNKIRDNYDDDSLNDQLEIFIQQKLNFILEQDYDLNEIDFLLESRVNPSIKKSMQNGYRQWRDEIDEKITDKFGKDLTEEEKKYIGYIFVSLLQGASIQYHLDSFDVYGYFEYCKNILEYILTDKQQ